MIRPEVLCFSIFLVQRVLYKSAVAVRSKAWVCGSSLAGIAGSSPPRDMDTCCECCVLSGRGLCVRLITRPEGVLPSALCLSVVEEPRRGRGLGY